MTPERLAQICYEANRVLGIHLGEADLPHWEQADERERWGWTEAAKFVLFDPAGSLESLHECWLSIERVLGWSYGPELDNAAKRHPHHVGWHRLPDAQKDKVALMRSIGWALAKGANRA